ncbi:glycine zipper domain-containing protein [Rhodopirellula sp.]|jgi:hypothetical protein|nr:glycine zipper domain-containing protein [Rhodopirellula sp.]MDA9778565.1 glycine zipper domain-containing protein [Rubripirellula sp.]
MIRIAILLTTFLPVFSNAAQGQYHTQRGATVGGLTGAIAGSIIGDNNGNAGAGAVIGGVVGAVTGGLLGEAKDQEEWVRRRRELVENSSRQGITAYPSGSVPHNSVTPLDVIEMVRSGLSEQIIVTQISQRGVAQPVTVKEIISLHQQGVSEPVLTALQQAKVNTIQQPRRSIATPSAGFYAPTPSTTTIWMTPSIHPSSLYHNYCPPYYQPSHHYHYRPRQNFGIHLRF